MSNYLTRLTTDNPENLEQNRIDYYLERPTNTIYNNPTQDDTVIIQQLIERRNQTMLMIMPQLKRKYQNRYLNQSYQQLLINIVNYINYLFQQVNLFVLDPLIELSQQSDTLTIYFDILTNLYDLTKKIRPILYRYSLVVIIRQQHLILIDWKKKFHNKL